MSLVTMTKERFIERWQQDALERKRRKREQQKRDKYEICSYITERQIQIQHRKSRKTKYKI